MPRTAPGSLVVSVLAAACLCACNACTPRTAPTGPDGVAGPSAGTAAPGTTNGDGPGATAPGPRPPVTNQPVRPPVERAPDDDANAPFRVEPPPAFRAQGTRVAAFNVEFLFDGVGDEGQADFPWKDNPAAARQHRQRVGEVIRMINPDVLMLEEVENRAVLDSMIAGPLAGMGYAAYYVQGKDSFTGQDMGLLSKLPVEATGRTDERAPTGAGTDTYGVSKNLWARLTIAGVPTTIIGVHFLAIPDNGARKPQREAQAEVIRRLAEAETRAGRAVIVLGDINDFDDAIPDRRGNRPITDVIARLKRNGPGDDDDLRSVLGEVAQGRRFTNFYDRNSNGQFEEGEFGAIDHVLLSPALYARLREVNYVHSHDPRLVTDHFPIVVTLR